MADPSEVQLEVSSSSNSSSRDGSSFLTSCLPELADMPASIDSYAALHAYSVEQSEEFWSTLAKSRLQWMQPFDKVTEGSFADENFQLSWFVNGKLNVAVNCVDRHYLTDPKKVALICDHDEINHEEYVTYEQLYKLMNQVANVLRAYQVHKGETVAIYMPTCKMTVACMLACARIGAVHSVIFAGFSAESLASRINDCKSRVVITANQGVRGGKHIELKRTVDKALEQCQCVQHVLVYHHTTNACVMNPDRDIDLDQSASASATECEPAVMDAEDPLFVLYTSGSTGKPKGLVHTQAGYLLGASVTQQLVFDYQAARGDVFGCLADVGWITGHSYVVYGPLCNGGTTVLFESTPIYPDPGRYWYAVERLRISQIYLAPTSLRLLIKYGDEWVRKHDRSSLRTLGSVGEPINQEAWNWYYNVVGEKRCKIADTWWQTETGAHSLTPLPCNHDDPIKPAKAMRPFLGISPVLLNEKCELLPATNSDGMLCIRKPWPSMARTIFGDHERFLQTYMKPFPGYYFTSDGANCDAQGHFQITGRVDDVINVSGHRIGTAEVEDALNEHAHVAESAVVGFPHEIFGQGVYAYVCLKEGVDYTERQLTSELKLKVKEKIAAYAMPHKILITPHLPKTRSGKIMRRILRKIVADESDQLGDISTLADPHVVDDILERYNKQEEVLRAAASAAKATTQN